MNEDFREFLELLTEEKVEYLLVRGYAVAVHGYPRYTGDIDFWVNNTERNTDRIIKVLEKFGMSELGATKKDLTKKDSIIQIGVPPNRIDLITSVEALSFEEAYKRREIKQIDKIDTNIITLDDLKNKQKSTWQG
jgi:phage replication-related protein YjqB (UPF0714/DUF867 family)